MAQKVAKTPAASVVSEKPVKLLGNTGGFDDASEGRHHVLLPGEAHTDAAEKSCNDAVGIPVIVSAAKDEDGDVGGCRVVAGSAKSCDVVFDPLAAVACSAAGSVSAETKDLEPFEGLSQLAVLLG